MVYIDLLVIEDLILNYIVVTGTALILNRTVKFKKVFLSSVIGTIPLIFIIININSYLLGIITFIFSITISIISYGYKNIIYTIRNIIYMYMISIFLAGSIYLLNTNYIPKVNSHFLNALVLITISPIITYIYIKNLKKLTINNSNYYKVDIYLKDKPKITVNAFLDTGNKLKDPYTGKYIILVNKSIFDIKDESKLLVPYNTIDSHGLLTCFKVDKIYIHKVGERRKVLIGLIDEVNIENAECILNQALLERI